MRAARGPTLHETADNTESFRLRDRRVNLQKEPGSGLRRANVGNGTDGRQSSWQTWVCTGRERGSPQMLSAFLSDVLLFSCLATFVTGIVIAVANLIN
jgi:hypothetical protein